MKIYIPFLLLYMLAACGQSAQDTKNLEVRVDSLERKLGNTYRPGLGEFMSGIQVHHAKLWFAGTGGNWPLTDLDRELVAKGMISRSQLIDAIAVGQFTPGPVFSSVTFIGWQLNG